MTSKALPSATEGGAFLHLLAVQRSLPKEAKFHQVKVLDGKRGR
jgi:hypothetical protein